MADIVSPFKLDPERIKELQEAGVDLEVNMAELELPELQYGDTVVGTLTPEEARMFVAYYRATAEMDDLERNITGNILRQAGDRISSSDRKKNLLSAFEAPPQPFEDEDAEKHFFRTLHLRDNLRAALFFQVSERMDIHHKVIGFRTKGRIVTTTSRADGMTPG